jgi:hypothetical protein
MVVLHVRKSEDWGREGVGDWRARSEHVGAETVGDESLDLVSICAEGAKLDLSSVGT